MTTDSTGSATPPHVDEEDGDMERGREEEEMSELSEESGKDWKPDMTGKLAWLHRCILLGNSQKARLEDAISRAIIGQFTKSKTLKTKFLEPLLVNSQKARLKDAISRAMGRGEDPRRLLEAVLPKGSFVPPDLDRITLWMV